jgi:hypothetical protein
MLKKKMTPANPPDRLEEIAAQQLRTFERIAAALETLAEFQDRQASLFLAPLGIRHNGRNGHHEEKREIRSMIYPCKGVGKFARYRAREGELQLRIPEVAIVILQTSRSKFVARFDGSTQPLTSIGDGQPIRGALEYTKYQVASRFECQVSPWSWTNKGGRACAEPRG